MHDISVRQQALDLLDAGVSRRDVCRVLGVSYNSTYRWQRRLEPSPALSRIHCFRCEGTPPSNANAYTYLLGQYLGDGHIVRVRRTIRLDISCCAAYPRIMEEVESSIAALTAARTHRRRQPGVLVVGSLTKHWLCLFPQHGPGMKHTRSIVLADWQRELIAADPRPLIRGLIHSDGCRATNRIHHQTRSGQRDYEYPRYFFSNVSLDIQRIYTDALDLLGIEWRQNRWNSISVARRDSVETLESFIGKKT